MIMLLTESSSSGFVGIRRLTMESSGPDTIQPLQYIIPPGPRTAFWKYFIFLSI